MPTYSEFQKENQFRFSEIGLDIYFGISENDRRRASRHDGKCRGKQMQQMQSSDWPPEHSEVLREHFAKGRSYSEIAKAINAKFGTRYSRNATIGRGKRMGLARPDRAADFAKPVPKASRPRLHKPRKRHAPESSRPISIFGAVETAKLRCVEIDPRHLSLVELERADCRYPYGGDEEGEAISFCGHPRRRGSSYCTPHFHLTRGPCTASERAAGAVSLRLVEAA
jgi:GcrA cell cycle regulator